MDPEATADRQFLREAETILDVDAWLRVLAPIAEGHDL